MACHPNPCRGLGEITFRLARAERIALRVYDPSGRCRATLLEGRWPAGEHRVNWRPRIPDQAGGLRYVCLQSPGERVTFPVLVLR